ncbi:hypothetical protein [Comamonas sp. 23]|uniref:hypothetical protein n=1 Tax=Comamonas sp. 23 TaxID=3415008 RepID=UPI003C6EE3D5
MSDANSEMSKVPGAELIPLSALLSLSSGFYDGRWIDGDSMAALVEECVRMAAPQAQPADALDAARLMFVMQDADGFVNVEKDKYDFAIECAGEAGREEPTEADELNGVRRLLDAAMAAAQEGGNAAAGKDGAA